MSRDLKPATKARVSSEVEMSFEIQGSKAQRGVRQGHCRHGAHTPPPLGPGLVGPLM